MRYFWIAAPYELIRNFYILSKTYTYLKLARVGLIISSKSAWALDWLRSDELFEFKNHKSVGWTSESWVKVIICEGVCVYE